jgi:hypothetical protein
MKEAGMGLTALERETVVSFNDADEMALVVTHQRRVITRLRKNPAAVLLEEGVFETSRWARFALPKNLISFRSKKAVFTEAERSRRAAQLAASSNGRSEGDYSDTDRRFPAASPNVSTESTEPVESRTSTPVDVSSDDAREGEAIVAEGDLV